MEHCGYAIGPPPWRLDDAIAIHQGLERDGLRGPVWNILKNPTRRANDFAGIPPKKE